MLRNFQLKKVCRILIRTVIIDPDADLQIISDPYGSGSTTLETCLQDCPTVPGIGLLHEKQLGGPIQSGGLEREAARLESSRRNSTHETICPGRKSR
jgi:hypothetical protein